MRLFNLLKIALACLLMGGLAHAQGVGASGDITGTVTDPSSAVIANATVTVTDIEKGTKRTIATDSTGEYRALSLLPSTYSVSVAKTGFQTEIAKNVVVTIGQTTVLDFHMKVSGVSEAVEVTTEPPVVDTERSHQANVITEQLIQDLPINRRDYLTFTLLAPGVSNSTRMAADQDFRVKQTPQSGLSFYGSNGRGNSVTVDGGEANDDSGGVRLTLSQDAVQEFQINRSNYSAELGGASGASINIVSKSGTNDLHGSLYAFFRNDAMDARNPFAFTQALQPGQIFDPTKPDLQGHATKDTLNREQFGGSVGFPLKKDRTFLYVASEGLLSDAQNTVPLLTNTNIFRPDDGAFSGNNQKAILDGLAALGATQVPCFLNQPTIGAATCAQILTNALTISPFTGLTPGQSAANKFLVSQFENNGGLFPFTTRLFLASARLDHQFSQANQTYLRYSFAHDREENTDVNSLTGFSRGSSIKPAFDHTLLGSWFHQFSPRTLNETRVQWNYSNFDVIPNTPGQVGMDLPGFGNFGTQIFLPSRTIMRRYELADNITVIRGHHTMKFGGYFLYRGNHSESHTFFPGRFVFGNLPGVILSPCLQIPIICGGLTAKPAVINALQAASLPSVPISPNPINPLLAGNPQFYQQGFDNPIYNYPRPWTSAYWQDSWTVKPNFTFNYGLRYELDAQYGKLTTYKKNFAPRLSFAWDPWKDHRTVIRGGFGIYYSPIYGQIADVVQTLGIVNGFRPIAQVFVPFSTASPVNAQTIFGTLLAQGKVQCTTPAANQAACITPADLAQFGIAITHTGPVPPLSVLFSGQPNYRNPYSEQAEFGIEREIARDFSVSLSGIYSHTLHLPVAIDTNLLPVPAETATSPFTGQQVSFRNWSTAGGHFCAGANIVNCFVQPALLQNDVYSSVASALYYGGILEVKKRFNRNVSLMGNYTFSKAISNATDFNSDFSPFDQTNLNQERSLSDFDQRHKVVVASVLASPWKNVFFSGFQLAPIINYSSGHPLNVLAGGTNINNDRHSTNDRPLGFGRNSGRGPDSMTVDMRLTKQLKLREKVNLQLMAEAFNLFNRTNFVSLNNEVPVFGAGFADPSKVPFNLSGTFVNPLVHAPGGAPGAYTAGLRRQLQLGARLVF
jgi:hypothetical protein